VTDLVLDWHEELERLAPRWPALPGEARRAVLEVVARFLAEDELRAAEERHRTALAVADGRIPELRRPTPM
jgi:hypothetical protein